MVRVGLYAGALPKDRRPNAWRAGAVPWHHPPASPRLSKGWQGAVERSCRSVAASLCQYKPAAVDASGCKSFQNKSKLHRETYGSISRHSSSSWCLQHSGCVMRCYLRVRSLDRVHQEAGLPEKCHLTRVNITASSSAFDVFHLPVKPI